MEGVGQNVDIYQLYIILHSYLEAYKSSRIFSTALLVSYTITDLSHIP